jgi:hypothetical protein
MGSLELAPATITVTSTAAQGSVILANGGSVVGQLSVLQTASNMQPYGGPGGGHHVPAKSAFSGAPGYNVNTALAIPNQVLKALKVNHGLVTGAQSSLYSAFAKSGGVLTWEATESIETQALIRGGMKADQALATVRQAIQALKDAGVAGPTRIPWGG